MHGLRQAPRTWYALFPKLLVGMEFMNSLADTSLSVFYQDAVVVYVLFYVDDIIVVRFFNPPPERKHATTLNKHKEK